MNMFDAIKSAIFGHASARQPHSSDPPPHESAAASADTPHKALTDVNVAAILDKLAADSGEKLVWRESIVDLLKALGLDSSQAARFQLAKEFGYTNDYNDTYVLNTWLHAEVMKRLEQSGGQVPEELKQLPHA